MRLALANTGPLHVGLLPELTAADAQTASAMLAAMLPAQGKIRPNSNAAQVIVVTPQSGTIALPPSGPIWLVTRDASSGELDAQPLDAGATFRATGLAILVLPKPRKLSEFTQ